MRQHLADHGIAFGEVARRVGTWPPHVSKILRSQIQITPRIAYRLQLATGLDALGLLHAQSRWQLAHLAAGTWPYPSRKKPRPHDADDEEL